MKKNKIYVCTVGTGTAGYGSNIAEGIMSAIRFAAPAKTLLLPSSSEDSVAVAEIVKEGTAQVAQSEIIRLSEHDDLERCRMEIERILKQFKTPENILFLNPTSGTKQMTTAAVLAAIDLEIENIEYITGPRENGVIITGKEEITTLNAKKFIAGKHAESAKKLIENNAAGAALMLLESYRDILPAHFAAAGMLHAWRRTDYSAALRFAAEMKNTNRYWRKASTLLSQLRNAPSLSLERIADIANYAELCIKVQEPEEALAVIYRLVEMSAKFILLKMNIDAEKLESFDAVTGHPDLNLSQHVLTQLQAMNKHKTFLLGLRLSLEILESTDCCFVTDFLKNKTNWATLQKRNRTRYGHGSEFINIGEVENLFSTFIKTAQQQWPEFQMISKNIKYPSIEELLYEK